MYRHIITFKADVSEDKLKELIETANKAFNNRVSNITGELLTPYKVVFEATTENDWCGLGIGMCELDDNATFKSFVETWFYEDDEEPEESCDVLEELAKPVFV